MAERKLEVKILGDSRSLERALGRSASATRRFGKESKLGAVGMGLVAGAAAGATVAIGNGLASALRTGISEFQGQAKASAQTAAALKSTGGAAGVTQKHIEGVAAALQSQTGLADDAVQGAQNLLLTFTKISNAGPDKIFDRATRASADLSVALGKDLQGSAMMVGKALNDPIKGVTALGRAGVQFTAGQKETIKSLVETGRVADAQKMILRELETQVSGSARAFSDSVPGQIAKAKRSFENLTESLVGSLMPAFDALLPLVTRGMASIAPVIENVARTFSDLVVQIAASSEFQTIATAFRDIAVAGVEVLSAALRVAIPLVLAIVAPIASLAAALTRSSFAMGVLTAAFASFIALRVMAHITAAATAIRGLAVASAASVGITSLGNSFRMLTLGMTSVSARAAGLAPGLTAAAGGISRTSLAASTAGRAMGNLGRSISGALGGPVGIAVTAGAIVASIIGGDLVRSFGTAKGYAVDYADAMRNVGDATREAKDSLGGLIDALLRNGEAQQATGRATADRVTAERELAVLQSQGISSGPAYRAAIDGLRDARLREAQAINTANTATTDYKNAQATTATNVTTLGVRLVESAKSFGVQREQMRLGVQAGTIAKSTYDSFIASTAKKIMGSQELRTFRGEASSAARTLRAEGSPAALELARALDGVVGARNPQELTKFLGKVVTLTGGSKKDVKTLTDAMNRDFKGVGNVRPSGTFFGALEGSISSAMSGLGSLARRIIEIARLRASGGQQAGERRENSSAGLGPNALSFFYAQRSAAASAGSGLSSMAREGFISRDPDAQAINARRKARQQDINAIQERELVARVQSAETADEIRRAEIDLAEFRDALAWERVETDADTHAQSIDDLSSQFARGEISAIDFQTRLGELVGGATGESNGKLFGERWTAAFKLALGEGSSLAAIIANSLGGETGAQPVGGPEPEDTGPVADSVKEKIWTDAYRAFAALTVRKHRGKKNSQALVRRDLLDWYSKYGIHWEKAKNLPGLYRGGVVTGTAFMAGERGPEAVIPLTGTRGRDYMSAVMSDVMRRGSGGTQVVVNVAGNEFSAEAFARKIGPELRRQIALTGSY